MNARLNGRIIKLEASEFILPPDNCTHLLFASPPPPHPHLSPAEPPAPSFHSEESVSRLISRRNLLRGPETAEINRGAPLCSAPSSLADAAIAGAVTPPPPGFFFIVFWGKGERQTIMAVLPAPIYVHTVSTWMSSLLGLRSVREREQPAELGGEQQVGGGDGVASLPQVKGNLAPCREGEGPDIYK